MKNLAISAVLRLYPSRDLNGIRVVFTDSEVDRTVAIDRLRQALEDLKSIDSMSYRRVKRYVRQIVIWMGKYSAASHPGSVQLGKSHVLAIEVLELASILIHETTHLRIGAYGIGYNGPMRERIERRCVQEQASFLRKCGEDGRALAVAYEQALELKWWAD